MRESVLVLVVAGTICALGQGCRAESSIVVVPFRGLPKIELAFEVDAAEGDWKLESRSTDRAVYIRDGHRLTLSLQKSTIHDLLEVRLDAPHGKALLVRSYSAKVSVPSAGLHAVLCPNMRKISQNEVYYKYPKNWDDTPPLYHCLVPESFQEPANSNCEAPFVLLTNPNGNNAVSAGWTKANRNGLLSGAAEESDYAITLARQDDIPFTGPTLHDTLVVSARPKLWFDVVRAYAKAFDRLNGRKTKKPVPGWATDPYFDSWYCYGDHINQEQILTVARKCKELGIRTILIDAGWDTPGDGGYIHFEKGILGDHMAQRDRFPDLVGAIKQMHEMGLRVELWCAPFWQGKLSWAYRNVTGSWHMRNSEGENHSLCPRHPKLPGYLRERFAWIAKTYDVDGMWLDAADSIPPVCTAEHEHVDKPMGEAFVECMLAVREGLRSVKPDSVIEVRPLHGNLNSKIAIDLIQPSDAPDKLDTQRLSTTHLRAWCYDGVVKSDPIRWGRNAKAATVGKFMATSICMGVPSLSVDFPNATEEQLKVTRAWLDFFHKHKDTLVRGEFRPVGAAYDNPDLMLVGREEAIIYLRNPNTKSLALPRLLKRLIVLNATELDSLTLDVSGCSGEFRARSYRPDWTPLTESGLLSSDGAIQVSQPVPQGGAVVVERSS